MTKNELKKLVDGLEDIINSIDKNNFVTSYKIIEKILKGLSFDKDKSLIEKVKESFGFDPDMNRLIDEYLSSPNNKILSDIKDSIKSSVDLINSSEVPTKSELEELVTEDPDTVPTVEKALDPTSAEQQRMDDDLEDPKNDKSSMSNMAIGVEISKLGHYSNPKIDEIIKKEFNNDPDLSYTQIPRDSQYNNSLDRIPDSESPIYEDDRYKVYKTFLIDNDKEFLIAIKDSPVLDSPRWELIGGKQYIESYLDPELSNNSNSTGNSCPIKKTEELIETLKSMSLKDSLESLSQLEKEFGKDFSESIQKIIGVDNLMTENESSESEEIEEDILFNEDDYQSSDISNNSNIKMDHNENDKPTVDKIVGDLENMVPEKASEALAEIASQEGDKVAEKLQEAVIEGESNKDELVNECGLTDEQLKNIDDIINSSDQFSKSIRKNRLKNKFMKNFSDAGLIEDATEQIGPEKVTDVIELMENMSIAECSECLAEVEAQLGEDAADQVQDAILNNCDSSEIPQEVLEKTAEIVESNSSKNFSKGVKARRLISKRIANFADFGLVDEEDGEELDTEQVEETNMADSDDKFIKNTKVVGFESPKSVAKVVTDYEHQYLVVVDTDEVRIYDCDGKEESAEKLALNSEVINPDHEVSLAPEEKSNVDDLIKKIGEDKFISEYGDELLRIVRAESYGDLAKIGKANMSEVVEELNKMTPEESAEALAKIDEEKGSEVAEKVQAEVLKDVSPEFANESEDLPEVVDEDIEDVMDIINESKLGQINCSRKPALRRKYNKYLRNFSLVFSKVESSDDSVVTKEEVLEKLEDMTPEDSSAVLAIVEEKLGSDVVDELVNGLIEDAEPIISEDESATVDEVISQNPDPQNFSAKAKRAYKRILSNFSEKLKEDEEVVDKKEKDEECDECEKIDITNMSSTVKFGRFVRKSSISSANLPSAGKTELKKLVGDTPYKVLPDFFNTLLARKAGLDIELDKLISRGTIVWRNRVDLKSPKTLDVSISEIIDLGNEVVVSKSFNSNTDKVEKILWSSSEDKLNNLFVVSDDADLDEQPSNFSEDEEIESEAQKVADENAENDSHEVSEKYDNDESVKEAVKGTEEGHPGVDETEVPSKEWPKVPGIPSPEVDEPSDKEIQENFSSKVKNASPEDGWAKRFERVLGLNR